MPERVLPTAEAAPPAIDPAELVTLDSPDCALLAISCVVSFAFAAPDETASFASVVVDADLRGNAHLAWCSAFLYTTRVAMMYENKDDGNSIVQWLVEGGARLLENVVGSTGLSGQASIALTAHSLSAGIIQF